MAKASAVTTPPRGEALSLGKSAAVVVASDVTVVVASDVTVGVDVTATVMVVELIPVTVDWICDWRPNAKDVLPRPDDESDNASDLLLASAVGTVIE